MDNWNRWGAADERGTANLIDADAVRRGLAAVRDGRPISLAAPIVANRGFGVVGRPDPQHFMLRDGGALLVRTGWLTAWSAGAADASAWPGLDLDCAKLLADADVTIVGADNIGVEVFPSNAPDCQVPLHVALVRGRRVYFSELLDLDELAASRRTSFLLVIAPLPLVGAVGSPVSPVAVV